MSSDIIYDVLIFDFDAEELRIIEEKAQSLLFPFKALSLRESFQLDFNYYVGNFIFGVVAAITFITFSLFLVYLTIASGLKICQQEIRLLRVIGLSNRKINKNFNRLLLSPILLGTLLATVFLLRLPFNITWVDFIYLALTNCLLLLFAQLVIQKKLRRVIDAQS